MTKAVKERKDLQWKVDRHVDCLAQFREEYGSENSDVWNFEQDNAIDQLGYQAVDIANDVKKLLASKGENK